jgi:hypothetical protein
MFRNLALTQFRNSAGACGRTRTYVVASTTPDLQSGALAAQPRMLKTGLGFLVLGLWLEPFEDPRPKT